METLAIIPAKGTSRRVSKKNIAMVAGKPLLSYAIEAGLGANCIDRLIVSTESHEVATIARKYGAEVLFMRPESLSRDGITITAVSLHALAWLEMHENYVPDFLIVLMATSPLCLSADIDAVMELAQKRKAGAVISVCPLESRASQLSVWLGPNDVVGEVFIRRAKSGNLPLYEMNGAVRLIHVPIFKELQTFCPKGVLAYIMPIERSLDINLPWHLYLADLILKGSVREYK